MNGIESASAFHAAADEDADFDKDARMAVPMYAAVGDAEDPAVPTGAATLLRGQGKGFAPRG